MKNPLIELTIATIQVKQLVRLGGDTTRCAVALGKALGWKWPTDLALTMTEASALRRLCDILNVNLAGTPVD
jgi:hypothetical protein